MIDAISRVPIEPQSIVTPLSRAAVFLVLTIGFSAQALKQVMEVISDIGGLVHTAPATPGDLLFHIRAERADICFDLEQLILQALGTSVTVQDEVQGFRYFDSRDLLGFVDGTENPTGSALGQSALIQSDDAAFAGGSYIVVQKYLHRLDRWQALDRA